MSHRELRNLTEMLRALGYPHLVSMQSFRTPNFELVADVLHWLVARYDSSISVDDTIETEADRVNFLKATAQAMLLKGRIRLSLKNLYSANGLAVKELLKVASVLHDAQRGAAGAADGGGGDDEPAPAAGGAAKFGDLKATRSLAVDIVRHGARLHELLALHPESRELHAQALSRSVEVADVQRRLAAQAEGMAAQVEEMARMLANVSRDEASLSAKIDKRKAELERHEKRLASLSAVRPAFLDEYERLEGALGEQYEGYLRNWRNLQYLEGQLDGMHAAEQEGLQDQQRQMAQLQTGLREEELRLLRGDGQIDAAALDEQARLDGQQAGGRSASTSHASSRAASRTASAAAHRHLSRPGGAGLRRGSADGRRGADARLGSAGAGGGQGQGLGQGEVVGSMNPEEEEDGSEQSEGEEARAGSRQRSGPRAAGADEENEEGLIDDDDEGEEGEEGEEEDGEEDEEEDDGSCSDDEF